MVERADALAAQTNKDMVREISNEIDTHALLLKLYAHELGRPGLTDKHTEALLQQWSVAPATFSSSTR